MSSATPPRPLLATVTLLLTLMLGACANNSITYGQDHEIHWIRTSAEYQALTQQVFTHAESRLRRIVEGLGERPWAVAMDADETILDNSTYFLLQGQWEDKTWVNWVKSKQAGLVPGARGFIRRVHEMGGKVAVVTNRRHSLNDFTTANLKMHGIEWDCIQGKEETGEKEGRWRNVSNGSTACGDVEIVMWIGDNIHDFPDLDQSPRLGTPDNYSRFGVTYFVLPNPVYGSWEGNPPRQTPSKHSVEFN